MSKIYEVIHKKSNVVVDGTPKLPSASTLDYGEIAINYGASGETLSIKNSSDQIVTFSADHRIMGAVSGAINELDGAIEDALESLSALSQTVEINEYNTTSALTNLDNRLDVLENTEEVDITGLVSSVTYSSQDHRIYFYDVEGTQISTYVDTTDFIKDGMVNEVKIATPTGGTNSGVTCLVVTFNTDAGKDDIEIPISSIFNPSNYYTKTETEANFLTTATTIPTTAAEVGAMATSERSNYLTTATTIPTEATISSSGFTKNGITGIDVNGTAVTVTNGVADITIPSGLPAVTAADNGKIPQVVNGAWALVTPTAIYTGTDTPLSSIGNDGDIYLQTS